MNNSKNIPEDIKENIINFLTNKLSTSQANSLLAWLKEDEGNKVFFDQMADIWNTSSALSITDKFDPDIAWEDVSSHLRKKVNQGFSSQFKSWVRPLSRVAAILTIILLSGLLIRQYISKASVKEQIVEITAPRGSRSIVMLADGTKVWLNSASKIKFSDKFGKTTRDVKLEGEAYFSVAKNKAIPFVVHASEMNITALGTSFNVKAYADEGTVETTLDEGSIKLESAVISKKTTEPLILKPRQKAIYAQNILMLDEQKTSSPEVNKSSVNKILAFGPKEIKVNTVIDTKPYTSWKDNRWLFRHEKLEDLARKLERRYDVEITFQDEAIKNYSFSGSLYDESIEQVFAAIKMIAPINYVINHKRIEISTNKYLKQQYEKYRK